MYRWNIVQEGESYAGEIEMLSEEGLKSIGMTRVQFITMSLKEKYDGMELKNNIGRKEIEFAENRQKVVTRVRRVLRALKHLLSLFHQKVTTAINLSKHVVLQNLLQISTDNSLQNFENVIVLYKALKSELSEVVDSSLVRILTMGFNLPGGPDVETTMMVIIKHVMFMRTNHVFERMTSDVLVTSFILENFSKPGAGADLILRKELADEQYRVEKAVTKAEKEGVEFEEEEGGAFKGMPMSNALMKILKRSVTVAKENKAKLIAKSGGTKEGNILKGQQGGNKKDGKIQDQILSVDTTGSEKKLTVEPLSWDPFDMVTVPTDTKVQLWNSTISPGGGAFSVKGIPISSRRTRASKIFRIREGENGLEVAADTATVTNCLICSRAGEFNKTVKEGGEVRMSCQNDKIYCSSEKCKFNQCLNKFGHGAGSSERDCKILFRNGEQLHYFGILEVTAALSEQIQRKFPVAVSSSRNMAQMLKDKGGVNNKSLITRPTGGRGEGGRGNPGGRGMIGRGRGRGSIASAAPTLYDKMTKSVTTTKAVSFLAEDTNAVDEGRVVELLENETEDEDEEEEGGDDLA